MISLKDELIAPPAKECDSKSPKAASREEPLGVGFGP
jgi:hypothetical protein